MLISDSHEFIFVHNYKVAGSSIRQALQPYATGPAERTSWFRRQCARLGIGSIPDVPDHLKAKEIREREPAAWEGYFTFGFVRNPWSWQVSLYAYMLENENHHQHDLICSMEGFDEYIEWRVSEDKVLQSSFFCDEEGNVIVDYIGRLENIQYDFSEICDRLDLTASLPHKNKSSHSDYRDYYTPRTRQLVERHFQEDIARFGYTFGGIKKNV